MNFNLFKKQTKNTNIVKDSKTFYNICLENKLKSYDVPKGTIDFEFL